MKGGIKKINNIVLKSYEKTKILKKVIKEKITDITVSIFGEKNYFFSENKNYLLIEIKNINIFSYQENKIYM